MLRNTFGAKERYTRTHSRKEPSTQWGSSYAPFHALKDEVPSLSVFMWPSEHDGEHKWHEVFGI